MRRQLLLVYGAASLSFAAGLIRDWIVVNRLANYGDFFGVMYCAALAASFIVNTSTFRSGGVGTHWRQPAVFGATTLLSVAIVWGSGIRKIEFLILCLPLPVLYILGATACREMFDRGLVFWSRIRDGLTSILMSFFLWLGMGAPSLLMATLLICALYFWYSLVTRPVKVVQVAPELRVEARSQWKDILYSNLAIALFTAWALWANNQAGSAFGYPGSIVVRFSVYFFQIMCIPTVLIVRSGVPKIWAQGLRHLIFVAAGVFCVMVFLPLEIASIGAPLAAILMLYASVAYMRSTSNEPLVSL